MLVLPAWSGILGFWAAVSRAEIRAARAAVGYARPASQATAEILRSSLADGPGAVAQHIVGVAAATWKLPRVVSFGTDEKPKSRKG